MGELLLVIAYIAQLYDPLKALGTNTARMQGNLTSVERVFALLDELPEVIERPHAIPIVRASGDVRFEDVSFSYDGDIDVLDHVSFTVPPGSRVGIQGQTGAGKEYTYGASHAVLRREQRDGFCWILSVDVRDYKLADLRNQFGIVLQDSVLFSTTIAENIAYARPGATQDQIIEAATLADAHYFISNMPNGYHTVVGERGMRLSGGERQRIALARAFLKDAPILLLDEPTSSVDEFRRALKDARSAPTSHARTHYIYDRASFEHSRLLQSSPGDSR